MTILEYPDSKLARQPIGYWSGHAYRTVVGQIRADLAVEGLTQPTWWILNHVNGSPGVWTAEALTDRLRVFDDQDTDFALAFADLVERRLVGVRDDGTLELTDHGVATLARAHQRGSDTRARTMAGVSDDDYVTALNVLRRIIDNLGGDSDIP